MSTSIPDGSTVLHHAAASVSCTAAQAIKVRHGGPLIVIPAALAGVIPPNPRCGLIKLWLSSLKRGDSHFLMHALEDVTEFAVESLVAVVAAVFFHPVTVCHVHRTRTPAGPKDLFERFAERT